MEDSGKSVSYTHLGDVVAVILLVAVEAAEAIVRKPAGFVDADKAQATLIHVRIGPGGEPQPVCGSPDICLLYTSRCV